MTNSFKIAFFALVLSLGMVACKSNKKADTVDSTAIDTTNVDTIIKDSVAKDTLIKTPTEVKKN